MSTLTQEITAYEGKRNELEADHPGKWVVFHDQDLVGVYDSFEEAATDAVQRFGHGPYLIREVGAPPITLPASVLYRRVPAHEAD